MAEASQNGVAVAQAYDEESTANANSDVEDFTAVDNNNYDTGTGKFEVIEEREEGESQDHVTDDIDDQINLLTQAFKKSDDHADGDDSDRSESSNGSSASSSSSEDEGNDSDSSSEEPEKETTPLQVRRERKIRRNKAFIANIKIQMDEIMNGSQGMNRQNGQHHVQDDKIEDEEDDGDKVVTDKEVITITRKRRGMIFSTTNKQQVSGNDYHFGPDYLRTTSLVGELEDNYPHRSKQIHLLCSQLVTTVQKSKFAWQMSDNFRSLGNLQYSEANYGGDKKLAAPSPIMITGASGNGKSAIVLDVMRALQTRINKGGEIGLVSSAYVDCALSESGSVSAVMNSAYQQLFECYHPSVGFGRHDNKDQADGNAKFAKGKHIVRSSLGGDEFAEDFDSDIEGNDSGREEDLLERQRKKRKAGVTRKNGSNGAKAQNNNPHTSQRTRLGRAAKAASEPTTQYSTGLKGSIQGATNRNTQGGGSVALFGRATSALLQAGNMSRKRSSDCWRCAFLILDNAERILSWKKHGSISPLTQLFLLPSVMGINLTLIFISKSSLLQHYREYYSCVGLVLLGFL